MKIAVVGIGFVGLTTAVLLAQKNQVVLLDILSTKVEMINNRESPIGDVMINDYLKSDKLNLIATTNPADAYSEADYIVIATQTNYNEEIKCFDTSSIENIIREATSINEGATFIIKSTVPIGYTEQISKKFPQNSIIFNPEFLREGHAMKDCFNPSRIIVGIKKEDNFLKREAVRYVNLLVEASTRKNIPVIYMGRAEAEAVKLFSNAYLALRVAFFNEIDTFSEIFMYNTKEIISGLALDPRIGEYYNNPSFGYGGYCLPKDTKQLCFHYSGIPGCLINSIIESNEIRKKFIINNVLQKISVLPAGSVVGVYRLSMKKETEDSRGSVTVDIIKLLQEKEIKMIVYEPSCEIELSGCLMTRNLDEFKRKSSIIISNRLNKDLIDVKERVYSRDIFNRD